ncbi:M20/M25/M40 family metallo-hydrolase [Alicyclobacillus sp. ALC3]|uniref:M20/M25/M40 family metallo-hydrolase n=1 Tax=Alicyclobacillus sp. ALC3 TaxID=2796143 RepID=UPI0023795A99|nr:M20/M25/M40 family metallo-hydrolase [Alicyclobacillus sp. ALC3]WDL97081.1 M20/M25/M40 family metallo-hydrolase [Alicyclobacillus sp. ALC3]
MDPSYVLSTFLDLVKISSHSLKEHDVAAYCRVRLEALGFVVEEDDAGTKLGGTTGNLLATLPGDNTLPPVMLAAHMDTVIPGEGVNPRVDADGVVWSDGTTVLGADDKAGVTAILTAVKDIVEQQLPHGPLQVVLTIGEEVGLQGAKNLDRSRLHAQYGLSLDSGGALGTLVVAGPAQVRWEAEFTGKSAHAGVAPERGVSAVKMAAAGVSQMPHGRIDAETTVNVSTFLADGPTNIVTDRVRLLGEARSRNAEKLERTLNQIEQAFTAAATAAGGQARFTSTKMYDGFRFSPADPVRARAEQALAQAGFTVHPMEGGGGSDANMYTSYGVPTINIGVGYEDIHSVTEHIRVADIEAAAQVAVAFCTLEGAR